MHEAENQLNLKPGDSGPQADKLRAEEGCSDPCSAPQVHSGPLRASFSGDNVEDLGKGGPVSSLQNAGWKGKPPRGDHVPSVAHSATSACVRRVAGALLSRVQ